jgi:hypothetical protein
VWPACSRMSGLAGTHPGCVSQIFSLLHSVLLHSRRRAPRSVVVVANSSAIGSSSAWRSIPPDGRSRRPRSTRHTQGVSQPCHSPPWSSPRSARAGNVPDPRCPDTVPPS